MDFAKWQNEILNDKTPNHVVVAGRRVGKTTYIAQQAHADGVQKNMRVVVIAPDHRRADDLWTKLLNYATTRAEAFAVKPLQRIMTSPDSGKITVLAGNYLPDQLRGATADVVLVDDAAYMDRQELQFLPTLEPKRQIYVATPRGKLTWFWRKNQDALLHPNWATWHIPSTKVLDEAELTRLRTEMPEEEYQQEIMAEFLDEPTFAFKNVATLMNSKGSYSWEQVVFGLIWGDVNDSRIIAVMGYNSRTLHAIIRIPAGYRSQQDNRLRQVIAQWQPVLILAPVNGIGTPAIEAFQVEGLPIRTFTITRESKMKLVAPLIESVNKQNFTIVSDHQLLDEMNHYQINVDEAGNQFFAPPTGKTEKNILAVALAYYAAQMPHAKLSTYA